LGVRSHVGGAKYAGGEVGGKTDRFDQTHTTPIVHQIRLATIQSLAHPESFIRNRPTPYGDDTLAQHEART
jgi:hypothetical protein